MDESLVWTGAVVAAAGAAFGWIAIKAQREHREWCRERTKVEGVVSRLVRRPSRGSRTSGGVETPVVRFRATNNVEYEVDAPEAPRDAGSVVEVAYDPAMPSGGRAVPRTPKLAAPVFLLVVGAILVGVGCT